MKALKILSIILIVLIAIVIVPTFFMSSDMLVEQTREMKAAPQVIWDQFNCLENWENWDEWHQDTNLVGTYSGPACGVGATNTWTYKNNMDGGSQTIIESTPHSYIKTKLDFGKMGVAESEIFLEAKGEGTLVKWNLKTSGAGIILKWMNVLMIKPSVRDSYSKGLENLDKYTEDMKPHADYSTGEIEIVEVKSTPALAFRSRAIPAQIAQSMGMAFGQIMEYVGDTKHGTPMSIWYDWQSDTLEFDNVIPLDEPMEGKGNIKSIVTYAGRAIKAVHTGDYESTQHSWKLMGDYIHENKLELNGDPYEVYITDPGMEPDPSKWITELYWPVK